MSTPVINLRIMRLSVCSPIGTANLMISDPAAFERTPSCSSSRRISRIGGSFFCSESEEFWRESLFEEREVEDKVGRD